MWPTPLSAMAKQWGVCGCTEIHLSVPFLQKQDVAQGARNVSQSPQSLPTTWQQCRAAAGQIFLPIRLHHNPDWNSLGVLICYKTRSTLLGSVHLAYIPMWPHMPLSASDPRSQPQTVTRSWKTLLPMCMLSAVWIAFLSPLG